MISPKTKAEMYRRLRAGEFGNTLRVWDTIEDVIDSGYDGELGLRCVGSGGGGPFIPNLTIIEAMFRGAILAKAHKVLYCEASPDEHLIVNAELIGQSYLGGPRLEYSTVKKPMRDALRDQRLHAQGPLCVYILRHVLSGQSYDDVCWLMDTFPDAVIELSVFSTFLGPLRGRNHVIWEVRDY